ncbi:MAG: hypothetical protein G01um101425_231 [Candidatus Peregrinibacteria bacterium Gr01-1014_25]|nr:MAG: hypothetical protein G01um101425_231 [Candidatus Peregrinibacteria bacterium Gr01-1014_25]
MSKDTRNAGFALLLSLAIVMTASISARVFFEDVKTVEAGESQIMTPVDGY